MPLTFAAWLIDPVASNTATTAPEPTPRHAVCDLPTGRPVARKIA